MAVNREEILEIMNSSSVWKDWSQYHSTQACCPLLYVLCSWWFRHCVEVKAAVSASKQCRDHTLDEQFALPSCLWTPCAWTNGRLKLITMTRPSSKIKKKVTNTTVRTDKWSLIGHNLWLNHEWREVNRCTSLHIAVHSCDLQELPDELLNGDL